MSEAGIRVDSRELERALDKLAEEAAAMPETWGAVGEALLPGVRQRTPVGSGRLRDSWTATGEPGAASISSDEPYAAYIEARSSAIADTLAASEGTVIETLEHELAKSARRIGFEVRE